MKFNKSVLLFITVYIAFVLISST